MEDKTIRIVGKVTFSATIKVPQKLFEMDKRAGVKEYYFECVVPLPLISSSPPRRVRVPLRDRNDFFAIDVGVSVYSEQVKIRMDSKVEKARGRRGDSIFGGYTQRIDIEWDGGLKHWIYTSDEGARNLLAVRAALQVQARK